MSRRFDEKPDIAVPHFCHVHECEATIQPSQFLCREHSQMLTPRLRRELQALEDRHWSEGHSSRWMPTLVRVMEAIGKERKVAEAKS